jgi:hypothetical protein
MHMGRMARASALARKLDLNVDFTGVPPYIFQNTQYQRVLVHPHLLEKVHILSHSPIPFPFFLPIYTVRGDVA